MFSTHEIEGTAYLWGYGLALGLSLTFTWITIRILNSDLPLAAYVRKQVATGKPTAVPFGGFAVILSFVITLWLTYFFMDIHEANVPLFISITVGILLMFGLGIYDDLYVASPTTKLAGQVIIALLLYFAGFQIDRIGDWLELGPFSLILTTLWIIGISNSVNLIDGQDGLAGGLIFLSSLTLVFVYLGRQIFEAPFLSVILSGSILGFLLFNFPPAKIIMGDTGSLPLGLLISLITLLPLSQGYTDEIYYLIPVITLLVPITDTSWAFFRRIAKGVSPFSRDAEHFHHRLGNIGFSPVRSIFILFGVALYFDLISLVPVYNIHLIPNFIPVFFLIIILQVLFLTLWLRKKERRLKSHT